MSRVEIQGGSAGFREQDCNFHWLRSGASGRFCTERGCILTFHRFPLAAELRTDWGRSTSKRMEGHLFSRIV